jgi:hypothetical protein
MRILKMCLMRHGNYFGVNYSAGMEVEAIKSTSKYTQLLRVVPPVDMLDYYAMHHDVRITVSHLSDRHIDAVCINARTACLMCSTCTWLGCAVCPSLCCGALCCYNGNVCFCIDAGPRIPVSHRSDLDAMLVVARNTPRPARQCMSL